MSKATKIFVLLTLVCALVTGGLLGRGYLEKKKTADRLFDAKMTLEESTSRTEELKAQIETLKKEIEALKTELGK